MTNEKILVTAKDMKETNACLYTFELTLPIYASIITQTGRVNSSRELTNGVDGVRCNVC